MVGRWLPPLPAELREAEEVLTAAAVARGAGRRVSADGAGQLASDADLSFLGASTRWAWLLLD